MTGIDARPNGVGSGRCRSDQGGEGQFQPNAPSRGSPEGQCTTDSGLSQTRYLAEMRMFGHRTWGL
jgi:hypothetical protein